MVTKKMTAAINKAIRPAGMKAEYIELDARDYILQVSYEPLRHQEDYRPGRLKYAAIRITYPDTYYAMPQYLTTRDLLSCYRMSDKTLNGYLHQVQEAISI
jgi:hypothetical protein